MVPMQQPPLAAAEILAVSLNGLQVDAGMLLLRDADDHLYAPARFFDDWNLRKSEPAIIDTDGTAYYELRAVAGLSYQWNQQRAELAISANSGAFVANIIEAGRSRYGEVSPYTTGGYINYDIALTQGPASDSAGGFFDMAFFRGTSLITSSFLARDDSRARLMTTWQRDFVDRSQTLVIGDAYNNSSAWGLGVLYGGLRFGTNFELRPDYLPFATPGVEGTALLPASVDVYVNNVLRSHQDIKAGPFNIQNLPVITGSGDMQVIVTDLLGREQIMSETFFVNPILLRKGLDMHSVEAGWLRNRYGLTSNDYGDAFASATYRVGVTDALTSELHAETLPGLRTAGLAVATRLPAIASVIETSAAISDDSNQGTGRTASVRLSYQGSRWSANARGQVNSANFRQLGSDVASLPRQVVAAQINTPLRDGTLSLNYLRRYNVGQQHSRILTINYAKRLFGSLQASLTVLRPLSGPADTMVQFTLLRLFGNDRTGGITVDHQEDQNGFYTQYQHATPLLGGTGYRAAMMNASLVARQELQVARNESFGSFQLEMARIGGETSTRQMMQGGIATIGDGVFLTRNLGQGFAIVDTNGIANVPVMLENQIVAYTDQRGHALVSNIQPYQPNLIAIDPLALPLDASVGNTEQTVMPRRCGCALVEFEVRSMRSATLIIQLPDGTPLPPWTVVTVTETADEYVVGSRGEVFVDLPYAANNLITATLADGRQCSLRVDHPPADQVSPYLGPLQCSFSVR